MEHALPKCLFLADREGAKAYWWSCFLIDNPWLLHKHLSSLGPRVKERRKSWSPFPACLYFRLRLVWAWIHIQISSSIWVVSNPFCSKAAPTGLIRSLFCVFHFASSSGECFPSLLVPASKTQPPPPSSDPTHHRLTRSELGFYRIPIAHAMEGPTESQHPYITPLSPPLDWSFSLAVKKGCMIELGSLDKS